MSDGELRVLEKFSLQVRAEVARELRELSERKMRERLKELESRMSEFEALLDAGEVAPLPPPLPPSSERVRAATSPPPPAPPSPAPGKPVMLGEMPQQQQGPLGRSFSFLFGRSLGARLTRSKEVT
jgi:hypothetical protein